MARKPTTQRWDKIGIELEGAWDEEPALVARKVTGGKNNHDGSVQRLDGFMGEIVTRPHTVLEHAIKDVRAIYPARVNTTCGLHVHLSYKSPLDLSVLADKPFWEYFQERWAAWGKEHEAAMGDLAKYFWSRYEGRWVAENADRGGHRKNFCKAEFNPAVQLKDPNQEHRYTQINFSSWHKYQTVETRMLPMFRDVELAVDAIEETVDIFDTYLNSHTLPKIELYKEWKSIDEKFVDETFLTMPDMTPIIQEKVTPFRAPVDVGEDGTYHIEGAMDFMLPFARTREDKIP